MNLIMPGPIINRTKTSPKNHLYVSDSRYTVKLAESFDEIVAALRLRFNVFNCELNEGFNTSYFTGRDEDDYDAQFNHLLVIEKKTGTVVGTYRLQTYEMSRSGLGFFSATEFDINKLGWFRLFQSVELGRVCIDREHRNGRVLFLLWKGIGQYLQIKQKRYLFGCCSFSSQNPLEGTFLMNRLRNEGYVKKNIRVNVKPGYWCYETGFEKMNGFIDNTPPLMEIYLRYGAKICSYPAIDREFKTIDFLVLLDRNDLNEESKRLFLQ